MLVDMARFEHGHRVWGHNLFWIALSSVLVAALQYRFHCIEAIATRLKRFLPNDITLVQRKHATPLRVLFLVCVVVQTIHLPCDMVVSGGKGLSDWPIKPFWPISEVGYVFPLIPWGDVGPTLILMGGILVLAKSPRRLPLQSLLTLTALCVYLIARGYL